ncbi:hypothetical protein EVJ50_01060 [Synechococcus sp. RSCCF101]|uniref:hypothetical protein n=1 Tax=Synechococcus sp. RSCCF101 TaxID=2511069 RepID=UPI0012463A68|nr:hypothetical protein [Synechococcus sp. RSCCF101]QEY31048.1 hypothetical protein EVJ50_01060 [Synechococcus sp. RSCCF101]
MAGLRTAHRSSSAAVAVLGLLLSAAPLTASARAEGWPPAPLSLHSSSPDGTITAETLYGDGSVVRREAGPGGTRETVRSGIARVCTQTVSGGVDVSSCN